MGIIAAFVLVFLVSYFFSATLDSFDEGKKAKAVVYWILLALSLVALDAIIEDIVDKMKTEGVRSRQATSSFTEDPVNPPLSFLEIMASGKETKKES